MNGMPRAITPAELPAAKALAQEVFRPGKAVTMGQLFPTLWSEANAANVRVIEEDGAIVAQIGLWPSQMIFFGHAVPSASMGAVCTRADVRGKGYATSLLFDSFRHCDELGIDVITISGGRGLYRRNECRQVGEYFIYKPSAAELRVLADATGPAGYAVRRATLADVPVLRRLYNAEPVRYSRTALDFHRAFEAETFAGVYDRPLRVVIVSLGGHDVAYVACMMPASPEMAVSCFEFAGDRAAVAAGVAAIGNHGHTMEIDVESWDAPMLGVMAAIGATPHRREPQPGTQFITNPVRFFSRLERYFAERLPEAVAKQLANPKPTADGRGVTLAVGPTEVKLPTRSDVIDFVFGTQEMAKKMDEVDAPASAMLKAVFPLPFPSPSGLTYV